MLEQLSQPPPLANVSQHPREVRERRTLIGPARPQLVEHPLGRRELSDLDVRVREREHQGWIARVVLECLAEHPPRLDHLRLSLEALGPLLPAVAVSGVEPKTGLECLFGRPKVAAREVGPGLTQPLASLSLPKFGHQPMVRPVGTERLRGRQRGTKTTPGPPTEPARLPYPTTPLPTRREDQDMQAIKRSLAITLALPLLFTVAACDKDKKPEGDSKSGEQKAAVEKKDPATLFTGDKVTVPPVFGTITLGMTQEQAKAAMANLPEDGTIKTEEYPELYFNCDFDDDTKKLTRMYFSMKKDEAIKLVTAKWGRAQEGHGPRQGSPLVVQPRGQPSCLGRRLVQRW